MNASLSLFASKQLTVGSCIDYAKRSGARGEREIRETRYVEKRAAIHFPHQRQFASCICPPMPPDTLKITGSGT